MGRVRPARVLRALPDSGRSKTGCIAFQPPRGSTRRAVSLWLLRRCFRDALDQIQRRHHQHLFRFGFDVQEAVLLELAEGVSEQLLLGMVADGIRGGLRCCCGVRPLMKRTRPEIRVRQRSRTSSEMTGQVRPLICIDSWKARSRFRTTSTCARVAPWRCRASTESL